MSRLRLHARLKQHGPQFLKAVLAVAILVAILLTADNKGSILGEESLMLQCDSRLDRIRNSGRCRETPKQDRLGGHLIDVLATGAAGSRELPDQLRFRDLNLAVDDEHG